MSSGPCSLRRPPSLAATLSVVVNDPHPVSTDIVDDDSIQLQRSIFSSKIERSRNVPPAQKIADAAALFDDTLAMMRAMIAAENPTYTAEQVAAEVSRRLRIARRLDAAGIYQPIGTIDDEP